MIQAQSLPPNKSVYDYPVVLPGQELTEEQQQQAQLAQIAGIILAVAAAKSGIEQATTNQLIALLRATDLTSEAAVKLFAKNAAALVQMAIDSSRQVTWAGVSSRASVVGIPFDGTLPSENEMPTKLRYSRGTGLSSAYARIADEYKKNLERTPDDPVIAELIRQYESQGMTPIPRPDNISHDAFQDAVNNDKEKDWEEIFRKAEQEAERSEKSEVDAWATSGGAKQTLTLTAGSTGAGKPRTDDGSAWSDRDNRELFPSDEADVDDGQPVGGSGDDVVGEAKEQGSKPSPSAGATDSAEPRSDQGDEADADAIPPENRLSDHEKEIVIQKYAQHKAEERAERMVSQDVATASRNAHNLAINKMPKGKLSGFRRVVHPELSATGSCGLCIVASTMRYTKRDLLPIHANCKCETAEIYRMEDGREFDPGHQINLEDLQVFYNAAGKGDGYSTHGWDLKKSSYVIEDNPEFGPTLVSTNTKRKYDTVSYTPSEYQARNRED